MNILSENAESVDSDTNNDAVEAAIIIPLYKQPRLAIEAIEDCLRQETDLKIAIIICIDGCPYRESLEVATTYAQVNPTVHVVAGSENKGLSANRNRGVSTALGMFRNVKALTFLDPDDRLHPKAMGHFYNELTQGLDREGLDGERIGWVFTDPYQIGGIHSYLRKPRTYSVLWHLLANSNSATSLIAADVFRAGCRFDEGMVKGSEDWDFWLQAVTMGFRGKYIKPPTFYYRRRAESMSSDAKANHDAIRKYIRIKHPGLYAPKFVLQREHQEMPRYSLICAERPFLVHQFSDPYDISRTTTIDRLIERFVEAKIEPIIPSPKMLIVSSHETVEYLKERRLFAWWCWRLEIELNRADFVTLNITTGQPGIGVRSSMQTRSIREGNLANKAVCLAISRAALSTYAGLDQKMRGVAIELHLPGSEPCPSVQVPICGLYDLVFGQKVRQRDIKNRSDPKAYLPIWKPNGIEAGGVTRELLKFGPVMPSRNRWTGRAAAIVLGTAIPAELRCGFANLVRLLRQGHETVNLFLPDDLAGDYPPGGVYPLQEVDDICLFGEGVFGPRADGAKHYFGAAISDWAIHGDHSAAVGMLAGHRTVVNWGHSETFAILYKLKGADCSTWVAIPGEMKRSGGGSVTTPTYTRRGWQYATVLDLSLAYEHAIDRIIVAGERYIDDCVSRGIPREKILCEPSILSAVPQAGEDGFAALMPEAPAQRDVEGLFKVETNPS